jgi:RNA polymerase sigma-70 factor (ECF subfamily)
MEKLTEKKLVRKLKEKDPDAFKVLVNRYSNRIYRLAMRYTKNPEDAEELLQEVFFIIYKKIHTFKGKSSLSTWIYSITSNAALTFLKKKNTHPSTFMEDAGLTENRLDSMLRHGEKQWPDEIRDPVVRKEINQVIQKAIDDLPAEYKDIFILKEIEKLPIKEISKIHPLSVGAIKTRLHRARLVLRAALRDYFNDWKHL